MANEPAEFHSCANGPPYGPMLSTSIAMPFNPYRPYRVPDHLNRSRFPVNMPPQQNRSMPIKAISYDAWQGRAPPRAPYPPSYSSVLSPHSGYSPHHGTPVSNSPFTPQSSDLGGSYFSAVQTPSIQESPEPWDEAWNLDRPAGKPMPLEDFGLGLEPMGTDLHPMSIHPGDAEGLDFPGLLTEVEPVHFDPGSPDGRSWSSISEASSRFVSDFPDFPADPDHQSPSTEAAMPGLDSIISSGSGPAERPQRRLAKSGSRGTIESPPQARYRTSPYPVVSGRSRSQSTGSVALAQAQRHSPYMHSASQSSGFEFPPHPHPITTNITSHVMPTMADVDFDMFCQPQPTQFPGDPFGNSAFFLPSSAEEPSGDSTCASGHTSPDTVNVLHSTNPSRTNCEHQFAGASKPPDLFGPLHDEQLAPPPEAADADESDIPRAQELRFEGDLYTPKYVRGHGNKREGWCGICKPGRWLVLKNSAFWYDKSFTHGISAATGSAFEGPKETRRMKGNPDVWEGLCHSCGDWIALISSKKKGTTWFRHAYKCHTHQKVKDTPKRRREVSLAKASKAMKSVTTESDTRDDSPYSLDSTLLSFEEDRKPSIEGISALHTISAII